jgi:indolepyruvate ferredoxin oxidoreductase, beta subunit
VNVLIAAVGGQGALLAARVLARYAEEMGQSVKVSEIHGMSQRGGSVTTHVRVGVEVHSPVIERATADVVLAFELLEGARYAFMLRPDGCLIASTQRILPLPVLTGSAVYPENLPQALRALGIRTTLLDASSMAERLGNARTVNSILIGVMARRYSSVPAPWHVALSASVPAAHREVNLRAFTAGWEYSETTSEGETA